jgi:hypothetical protein
VYLKILTILKILTAFLFLFAQNRCLQQPGSMDPSFDFELRGPVKMKGRDEPMTVYYLTRDCSRPRVRSVLREYNIKAPFSASPAISHRDMKNLPGCPMSMMLDVKTHVT